MAPHLFSLTVLLLALCATAHAAANNSSCHEVSQCVAALDAGNTCKLLPIPKKSLAPTLRKVGYNLRKLRSGIWSYHDGTYFTLIIHANRRLVVIDLPDSQGSNKSGGSGTRLTDAVEEILRKRQPRHIDVIYSHAHFDHIGGATRFVDYMKRKYPSSNLNIYGTQGTRDILARSPSGRAPPPTKLIYPRGRSVWVRKGLVIRMDVVGGHTADDVLIHIPSSRWGQPNIVHFVDVVFPGWAPFLNLALTKDFGSFIDVHHKILKYKFDIFSAGHLTRLGSRSDVKKSLRFSQDLLEAAKISVKSVTPSDVAAAGASKVSTPGAQEFGNIWYAFDISFKLQIDTCYRIMLEKWGCDLAGLDVVLRSHCFTAIQYVIIDL